MTLNVLAEAKAGVLSITLNRPEVLNILDVPTRQQILKALKARESDSSIGCVVVRSTGDVFSAGADIKHLVGLSKKSAKAYSRFVRSFLEYVENFPKPTIGAVTGLAVGGGLELLLALDIVVATPEARFGQTELNVGLVPGGGGSQRLPRLVGLRKAKEMVYTGGLISAQEALEIGLVNRVVSKESLEEEVAKLCSRIISKNPQGISVAKQSLNLSSNSSLGEGLKKESELYSSVLTSRDAKEAMKAFLHKREPSHARR